MGQPRVWFVSTRPIAAGEELLFDYGDNYWDDPEEVKGFSEEEVEDGKLNAEDDDREDIEDDGFTDEDSAVYMKYSDDPAQNWAL
jgi:SET domain-containing protein